MSSADKYTKPIDTIVTQLAELQLIASRVQDQRKALVALDERRQKLREAEGILRKSRAQSPDTWICMGQTTFIQFPTTTAAEFLAEDRKIVEEAIVETDKQLRQGMDELLKKEGNKDLTERGFNLKSII